MRTYEDRLKAIQNRKNFVRNMVDRISQGAYDYPNRVTNLPYRYPKPTQRPNEQDTTEYILLCEVSLRPVISDNLLDKNLKCHVHIYEKHEKRKMDYRKQQHQEALKQKRNYHDDLVIYAQHYYYSNARGVYADEADIQQLEVDNMYHDLYERIEINKGESQIKDRMTSYTQYDMSTYFEQYPELQEDFAKLYGDIVQKYREGLQTLLNYENSDQLQNVFAKHYHEILPIIHALNAKKAYDLISMLYYGQPMKKPTTPERESYLLQIEEVINLSDYL